MGELTAEGIVRLTEPVDTNDMCSWNGGVHDRIHDHTEVVSIEIVRDLTENNEVERAGRPLVGDGSLLKTDMCGAAESALGPLEDRRNDVARSQRVASCSVSTPTEHPGSKAER
jgi:hypothetical protein